MAKQLYDYWFVQFDFPNEEGKPYRSSGGKMVWNEKLKREIPERWFGENICSIADILSGGTPSKKKAIYWDNGTIPFFAPKDYSGNIFQISTEEQITEEGLVHCASSLFEKGVIVITARGSIGKLVVVGTPMAMNQSCYALQSKTEEFEYLYFLTRELIESLKAKGSGSVFKSIIASDIENSWLCIGSDEVVSVFCNKVKPIFEIIKEKTLEIAVITKQRDDLLHLLMNGQVKVGVGSSQLNYDLLYQYSFVFLKPTVSFIASSCIDLILLVRFISSCKGRLKRLNRKVMTDSKTRKPIGDMMLLWAFHFILKNNFQPFGSNILLSLRKQSPFSPSHSLQPASCDCLHSFVGHHLFMQSSDVCQTPSNLFSSA